MGEIGGLVEDGEIECQNAMSAKNKGRERGKLGAVVDLFVVEGGGVAAAARPLHPP
jgi:hypothetical protein